ELPDGFAEYWILATGQRGVIRFDALDMAKVNAQIEKAVRGMLTDQFKPDRNCRNGLCAILGSV
ncbi:MAG: hypothetical protein KDA21_06875, partial [Phycisphaerales bacterium]|nr:hypothetical protein [Phycisphaerales bacterium]